MAVGPPMGPMVNGTAERGPWQGGQLTTPRHACRLSPLGVPRADGCGGWVGGPRVPGVRGEYVTIAPSPLGVHRADGRAKVDWVARVAMGPDGGQRPARSR